MQVCLRRLLTEEDPKKDRSRKQQNLFNEALREQGRDYVQNTVMPWVEEAVGRICRVSFDGKDRRVIHIHYPGVFEDRYLRADIRLEFGPFSEWIPHGEYSITSYAAEEFADLFSVPQCRVMTIKAERTFWEKTVILHQESFRTDKQPVLLRYSRHYYDIAMMCRSKIKDEALRDLLLLEQVVKFNERFFPRVWAHYELAKPGTMRLMPAAHLEKSLRADYSDMRNMVFGVYPEFDEILSIIKALQDDINSLK